MAAVTWKCPNCGGGLIFDPDSQKFACEYCLSQFSKEELEQIVPNEGEEQTDPNQQARTSNGQPDSPGIQANVSGNTSAPILYMCPSCGAEIVTDETTAATFCFYCHNPVVLKGRLDGAYEPDYVLPFAIEKEKAKEIFLTWLKNKRFVPTDFYSPEQIEKMTGVYFPYWLYSCQVDGQMEAEATKLRVWESGTVRYTETQKYDVSRKGQMKINHVTRNALKKADKQLVEGVMPFELQQIKPFSMAFLSGFLAEKRDMEQGEFKEEIETEVQEFARNSLRGSIGPYNQVNVRIQRAEIRNPMWNYALLPVWTLTYKGKKDGTIYYFACNGQTGKLCGKLPIDSGKLWIFFLEMFLPLLAVLLVAGYLI